MKVIPLHKNEEQLIKRALRQHRDAQQLIYEMHAPKMLSICRYYIKDQHTAEDIMLQGFFKVFKQLKSFKCQGSFEGWIRQIMVREALNYLRKQKRLDFHSDIAGFQNQSTNNIHTHIEVEAIQKILDELPEGYKTVFVLYAVEGYKHSEIAELLNISEGTSKSQLFKARQLLQLKIKEHNTNSYGAK